MSWAFGHRAKFNRKDGRHRKAFYRYGWTINSGKLLIVQITVGNLGGSIRQQTRKTIGTIGRSSLPMTLRFCQTLSVSANRRPFFRRNPVTIISCFRIYRESGRGSRHGEVVQRDKGLWIYSAGHRRQGHIRPYFGRRESRAEQFE